LSATPVDTEQVRPDAPVFAQKAVEESGGNVFDPGLYGLKARLDVTWVHGLKSVALGFH